MDSNLSDMIKKYLFVVLLSLTFGASTHAANKEMEIVAVVGDDAISSLDVQKRMELAISSSGLNSSAEVKEKLFPQIIRVLIDEKLYAQEAKKLNLSVDEMDLKSAVMNLEEKNGIKYGTFDSFLKEKGIPADAAKDQLRSQLLWNKITSKKIRPDIVITERELEEKMENISHSAGVSELNVSEIVLAVSDAKDEKRVRSLADKLVKEIRDGAKFASVAKEFSSSTTAASGGDMGWVPEADMPKEITAKVRNLGVGDVSDPFRIGDSYHIVTIKERRAIISTASPDDKISIKQAFVSTEGADGGAAQKLADNIRKNSASVKSCGDFDSFAKNIKSELSTQTINTGIKDLNAEIGAAINSIKVGGITNVIKAPAGLFVFMLCERTDPKTSVVLKNRVYELLMRDKVDLQAQKYLQNLRKNTFIEIRV